VLLISREIEEFPVLLLFSNKIEGNYYMRIIIKGDYFKDKCQLNTRYCFTVNFQVTKKAQIEDEVIKN